MGRGSLRSVPRLALGAAALALACGGSPSIAAAAPVDADAVVLDEIGPDWSITDEQPGSLGSFTRTWGGPFGQLTIIGVPVSDPPGVETMFGGLNGAAVGFDVVPERSLELGAWLVSPGGAPGDSGFTAMTFASAAHLFTIMLVATGADLDGPAVVLDLARRQIDAAGGPPVADTAAPPRQVDDGELVAYLPDEPPAGYGLPAAGMTVWGTDQLELATEVDAEVADFLNNRTKNVVRVWGREGLTLGVGINEYPYEIFAAAALGEYELAGSFPIDPERRTLLRDARTFRQPETGAVGVVFRRAERMVLVLAEPTPPESEATAIELALDTAAEIAALLPHGDTEPYRFPEPPTRVAGLGLTALVVVAAVAGSRGVASLRARRVRRRWDALDPPVPLPPPSSPPTVVVELDDDAAELRHRGRLVAGVQMLTVIVGVVALAGDFGTVGMVVAAASLVTGLVFSRWWIHREIGLLGPTAPSRAFVRPRPLGALVALVTFAVLGVGVSFFLKGVRYLIFDPTLAHLRWSDRLGLSPRAVAVAFTLGGLAVTFVGAGLYRLARALSRAGAQAVLADDPRPPALYLRSFADDSLPLPTIASARRPLFELFSMRGADPFEESVAWELNSYAPVVAVGRPGGTLRSLGAAREHLEQASWQDEIAERMTDSRVLVLAPGETEGLAWELGAIVRGGHLAKTVFVFPPLSPVDLARRWHHTVGLLHDAGAAVGALTVPAGRVHTVRVAADGELLVTAASTRDEATYRVAVDRAIETLPGGPAEPAPVSAPHAAVVEVAR